MPKCASPRCNNKIKGDYVIGWCEKCWVEFREDLKCMEQPPSFFYRLYDFIATRVDRFMFNIENIHDRKKIRKREKGRVA